MSVSRKIRLVIRIKSSPSLSRGRIPGPRQRIRHKSRLRVPAQHYMRQDVFLADVLHRFCLLEELRRLAPGTAEKHSPARFPKAVIQSFQGVQSCCIDRRHVPQAKNHDGRKLPQIDRLFEQLLGCTEQKRTVNAENGNVPWYRLVL